MKDMIYSIVAGLLLIVCLLISAFFVYEATVRTFTDLEAALFQIFALATGLIGSFIFGRQSVHAAARGMVKDHARPAFRRLISLYEGISRMAAIIERARNLRSDSEQREALAELSGLVISHLATADDALEDWRDIVPEELTDLRSRLSASSGDEG